MQRSWWRRNSSRRAGRSRLLASAKIAVFNSLADAKRAMRRADRWRRANGSTRPPSHITANEAQAIAQINANEFPTTETPQ